MDTKSIIICGVGGQGIILASDVISYALFKSGLDVKKNEIHGMSQREGSVVSFIRFGDHVYSPVVPLAEGDYLLAFEKLEAIRNSDYLKDNGCAIVNTQEIPPTPVQLGIAEYPGTIEETLKQKTSVLKIVNAMSAAKEAGNFRAVNIILVGVLSRYLDMVSESAWTDAIQTFVKKQYIDVNMKAFQIGKNL